MAIAESLGLTAVKAKAVVRDLVKVIADWRQLAKKLRLPAATVAAYASAFEHEVIDEARALVRS